jgi:signal transduction histidine kinase
MTMAVVLPGEDNASHMSSAAPPERAQRTSADRYDRLLEVHALMAQLAREIGPALELERVLQIVLNGMRSLVDFDGGSVSLVDEQHLFIAAADPAVSDEVMALRLPIGAGISGRAVQSGQTQYSPDIRADSRVPSDVSSLGSNSKLVSYLAVPLIVFGEVIGAIQVNSGDVDAFDDDDRTLLEGLATQVAGAIESARRFEKVAELEILKSDFIARVSHELRTPITIMSGFVSTLLAHHDELDGAARRQMLERVEIATARLSGLIDELLMLSKLEAGVVAATRELLTVTDVLEQVRRESARPEAIVVECDPALQIESDQSLLVRALGFLVDNALKYAGAAELHGSKDVVEVIDHGPGIRADARIKVFERFTRDTDKTTVPGMGVGLPMARTLLAAAGADLVLEDSEGGGARMVVRFWD